VAGTVAAWLRSIVGVLPSDWHPSPTWADLDSGDSVAAGRTWYLALQRRRR